MSRSRPKLDTSRIEYDDVVDSPSLKGMVSFLEIPPGELPKLDFTGPVAEAGIPPLGTPQSTVPEQPPPSSRIPELSPPEPELPLSSPLPLLIGSVESGTQEKGTPHSRIVISTPPESVPALAYPPVVSRPLARVRRATLAQDGHSFGEQALYDALWQHAHPRDTDSRIVTLGYRRMAELARLTVNNCKANIQALLQKLAVEEVASFTHSQGRTYLVYSYSAIIQRRRQAGLTHYIKSRGVVFVDPDTGEPLTIRIRDRSGIPFSGGPQTGAVPEGDTRGTPEPAVSGAPPSAGPPYSQLSRNSFRNTTSSALPELIQGLRQIVDFVDDEAAAVLWHQCRRRAEDCTPDEILHFARGKAAIFRSGKIQNPVGFLLAVVPKCFEGASFLEYRREQAARAREAEEQMVQMRREFEAILQDPNSSEEDRQFVERMLAEGQGR
jgi:hypothetical protein